MARGRLVAAALAGILVSFLLFMVLQVATPDPELRRGEGEVRWERFQFATQEERWTRGSVARIVNAGDVPLDLVLTAPSGENLSFQVPPGRAINVTLSEEGRYGLRSPTYPWGETQLEVRSANPFVRFFENLFRPGSARAA